jgi:hypothetical protein
MATLLLLAAAAGCDDDPSGPGLGILNPAVIGPAIIGQQGSIPVFFGAGLDSRSALDPANFVVTNTCTGLRVPGALRIGSGPTGDTVIFTPASALPFLTQLNVRIQNVQGVNGQPLSGPYTFFRTTEAPPVTDVSWEALNSPTRDPVAGIDFVSRQVGFIQTSAAEVYRTDNGGLLFGAIFKRADVAGGKGLRAANRDTVYMVAAPNIGGTSLSTAGFFRSINAAVTFDTLYTIRPADMNMLAMQKVGARHVLFSVGNFNGQLTTWRYDAITREVVVQTQPLPAGSTSLTGSGGDISPDTTRAVAVGLQVIPGGTALIANGAAYYSTNSGRTFSAATLPANTRRLLGAGFVDNVSAILTGDSSMVLRLNTTTGIATRLDAAAGIPQTQINATTGEIVTFRFTKAEFAPDDRNVGWIIGEETRRVGAATNLRRGVILMTRNGGTSWTRQAVSGAEDVGLSFARLAPPSDINSLAKDFSAIGGFEGFVTARRDDTQTGAQVCSFETP